MSALQFNTDVDVLSGVLDESKPFVTMTSWKNNIVVCEIPPGKPAEFMTPLSPITWLIIAIIKLLYYIKWAIRAC